jgi:hypothetical protein
MKKLQLDKLKTYAKNTAMYLKQQLAKPTIPRTKAGRAEAQAVVEIMEQAATHPQIVQQGLAAADPSFAKRNTYIAGEVDEVVDVARASKIKNIAAKFKKIPKLKLAAAGLFAVIS